MATSMKISCEICGVNMSGPEQYKQHLLGKMHKKKTGTNENPEPEIYTCDVCKLECSGRIPWQHHLEGRNHAKNYRKAMLEIDIELKESTPKLYPSLEEFTETEATSHKCLECNVVCSGVESLIDHKKGKKHAHKVSLLQFHQNNVAPPMSDDNMHQSIGDPDTNDSIENGTNPKNTMEHPEEFSETEVTPLKCLECNIVCSGVESLINHKKGKKHARKVSLLQFHQNNFPTPMSDDSMNQSVQAPDTNENETKEITDTNVGSGINESETSLKYSVQSESSHHRWSDVKPQEQTYPGKLAEEANFKCHVCNTNCTGPESYIQHMKGKLHAKKVRVNQLQQKEVVVQTLGDVAESAIQDSCDKQTVTSTTKDSEAAGTASRDPQNGDEESDSNNVEMPYEDDDLASKDAAKVKKHKFKSIFKKKSKTPHEA